MKSALFLPRKVLLATLFACIGLYGQAAFAAAPRTSDAELDRIVQRLESSGKLDAALERSIERRNQKQQEARRKQQEERLEQQRQLSKEIRKPDPARDHIRGNADAEVSIIEFSDYECPYCKRFHGTPEEVLKRFDGRVNLVWRHFPLEIHNPAAAIEAEAAECAAAQGGSEVFWKFSDILMQRTVSNGKGMPVTVKDEHPLLTLVGELKLDKTAFKACMDEGRTKQRVRDDMENGINAGIEGTPGMILYHNKTGRTDFVGGALNADALEKAVRKFLEVR